MKHNVVLVSTTARPRLSAGNILGGVSVLTGRNISRAFSE